MALPAAAIVAALDMRPHPEGGWYVETFRDGEAAGRGHSTAIYFLLEAGQVSAWHRVRDAAEVWHYYCGAALELSMAAPGRARTAYLLGPDIAAGERPQHVVPADVWQTARSLGAWTLCGCTSRRVSPFRRSSSLPPAGSRTSARSAFCQTAGSRRPEPRRR